MSILETPPRPAGTNGSAKTHARHVTEWQAETRVKEQSSRSDRAASADELRDRAIQDQARAALRSSAYHPVRHVSCEVRECVLILRGRVPSFYMKQMAQNVVRHLLIDALVMENRVEVDWT